MPITRDVRPSRLALLATGTVAALTAATFAPAQGSDAPTAEGTRTHRVILSGLDNPRQLALTGRTLIIAEAGHGSSNPDNCSGSGENATCIGRSGEVTRWRIGAERSRVVMDRLLSGAGPDGSFAVGADGAGKRPGGRYFAIVTEAPPDVVPEGMPGWQSGKLLAARPGGRLRVVANISRFERRHDVDGEGVESNPYALLALKNKVLVADAAGDYIAQVSRSGKVSVWAVMPEYGRRVDAVPTVLTKGHDGFVYVGELHSERPNEAKVWKFDRQGNPIRSWGKFTTVTGVARGKNGALYVSELFSGCGFDKIPRCFPGRVIKVSPDGERTARRVPFPAGVAVRNGKVFVNAFSISPETGFGGNPAWSGQLWRVFF